MMFNNLLIRLKVVRVFFFSISLILSLTLNAQRAEVNPSDPAFIARYADLDFKGSFAAFIDSNTKNNYFLVDFSKLSTHFEQVYFMNLSFSNDEIINIDPDIFKSRVCFISNKQVKVDDVLKIFDELKKKVNLISSSWSGEKQSQWLNENDKYKN